MTKPPATPRCAHTGPSARGLFNLSSDHLSDWAREELDTFSVPADRVGFGWLVWPFEIADVDLEPGVPEEMHAIKQAARDADCDFLLFEDDGPIIDGLPTLSRSF